MKFIFVIITVLVTVAVADEKYSPKHDDFDVDALVANEEELRQFSGCFLDRNPCDKDSAAFKKDLLEAVREACAKCTDAQKHLLHKFLNGIKDKLPQDYEEFKMIYDPENKHFEDLMKALEKY